MGAHPPVPVSETDRDTGAATSSPRGPKGCSRASEPNCRTAAAEARKPPTSSLQTSRCTDEQTGPKVTWKERQAGTQSAVVEGRQQAGGCGAAELGEASEAGGGFSLDPSRRREPLRFWGSGVNRWLSRKPSSPGDQAGRQAGRMKEGRERGSSVSGTDLWLL